MSYSTNSGAIAATTFVVVPYDTVTYDPSGTMTTIGAAALFTVPVNGIYLISSTAALNSSMSDTSRFLATIYKNGAEAWRGTDFTNGAAAPPASVISAQMSLVAGETVQIRVWTSQASQTIGGGSAINNAAICWISPT